MWILCFSWFTNVCTTQKLFNKSYLSFLHKLFESSRRNCRWANFIFCGFLPSVYTPEWLFALLLSLLLQASPCLLSSQRRWWWLSSAPRSTAAHPWSAGTASMTMRPGEASSPDNHYVNTIVAVTAPWRGWRRRPPGPTPWPSWSGTTWTTTPPTVSSWARTTRC